MTDRTVKGSAGMIQENKADKDTAKDGEESPRDLQTERPVTPDDKSHEKQETQQDETISSDQTKGSSDPASDQEDGSHDQKNGSSDQETVSGYQTNTPNKIAVDSNASVTEIVGQLQDVLHLNNRLLANTSKSNRQDNESSCNSNDGGEENDSRREESTEANGSKDDESTGNKAIDNNVESFPPLYRGVDNKPGFRFNEPTAEELARPPRPQSRTPYCAQDVSDYKYGGALYQMRDVPWECHEKNKFEESDEDDEEDEEEEMDDSDIDVDDDAEMSFDVDWEPLDFADDPIEIYNEKYRQQVIEWYFEYQGHTTDKDAATNESDSSSDKLSITDLQQTNKDKSTPGGQSESNTTPDKIVGTLSGLRNFKISIHDQESSNAASDKTHGAVDSSASSSSAPEPPPPGTLPLPNAHDFPAKSASPARGLRTSGIAEGSKTTGSRFGPVKYLTKPEKGRAKSVKESCLTLKKMLTEDDS